MEENAPLTDSVKPEPVSVETPNLETQQGVNEAAITEADSSLRGASASETAGNEGDAKKTRGANERIRELVEQRNAERKQREQAEQDAAYWRTRVETLTPKPAGTEQDHPDDASYRKAILKEAITETQREAAIEAANEAQERALRLRAQSFKSRVAEFKEKAPDFDQVAYRRPQEGGPVITPLMAAVIEDSEGGPQTAYYLGKNPELSHRIASLPPHLQAREIGKLEARLSETPAKRTTAAPTPVKTVGSGSGNPVINLETVSVADFIKIRNAEEAAKRGR